MPRQTVQPARQRAFVEWAAPFAVELSRRTGIHWGVIVAQWCHETGFGTSELYRDHRNLAGIKNARAKAFRGPVKPGTSFRSYATLAESLTDWERVIRLPSYDAVRAATTIVDQITALGASPWDAGHYRGRSESSPPGYALTAYLAIIWACVPVLGAPAVDVLAG